VAGPVGHWIDIERERLEKCTNLYQTLLVGAEATHQDILASAQKLLNALSASGGATEVLSNHYRSAYDVIGSASLRMQCDAASRLGVVDCSKLFSHREPPYRALIHQ
jgi:hypothetical protein